MDHTTCEAIIREIRACFTQDNGAFVPLHEPIFQGNEKAYLNECIDSTFVSSVGKFVDQFEAMICEISGAQYAIAIANGTCALHLALLGCGVSAGDEVITQPLTFVATANAIAHCGAEPVFIDVDAETFGMSPEALEAFLAKHTTQQNGICINKHSGAHIKACVPVHVFGHPCKIDRIVDICAKHHITVIEDAAEALGSRYQSQMAGIFGTAGVYSFNGNKIVTSGGGGAIVTDDETLAKRLKHLSTTAKLPHAFEYIHDEVGYNYRLTNLSAALACAQLEQLGGFITKKRQLAEHYAKIFNAYDDVTFVREPKNTESIYWLQALLLANLEARNLFLESAQKLKMQARPAWMLMTDLPMYRDCFSDDIPVATDYYQRLVNIPSSANAYNDLPQESTA